MSDMRQISEWAERGIRIVARIVALGWAMGWIMFGLISGIGEGLKPLEVLIQVTLPGLIFLITALIAWRWEGLGGTMLFLEGMAISAYFLTSIGAISFVGLYFIFFWATLPALIVGVLFIVSWRKAKVYQAHRISA